MQFRTPALMTLGVLLATLSLALLGLAADNVAYVNNNRNSPVEIHYMRWNTTAQRPYQYWLKIDYVPSRFSLSTMNAMLAASILCILAGVRVAAGAWMVRKDKVLPTSFSLQQGKRGPPPFLPTAIALSTIAFAVTFALAVYTYQVESRRTLDFYSWLPTEVDNSKTTATTFQVPFTFTPEVWNCFLAPYAVHRSQQRRLNSLCREARVAKQMMIPVLLLSAGMLACLVWTWSRNRLAAASEKPTNTKEVEEVSVHTKE